MKKYILSALIALGVLSALTAYALVTLPPTVQKGDLIVATSTTSLVRLPTSTAGYVLTMVNGIPTWALASSTGSASSTILYQGYGITLTPNPINTTGTVAVNTSTLTSYITTLGYLTSASGTAEFYPLSGNPSNFTTTTIQSVLNSLSAVGLATYNSSTGQFSVSSSSLNLGTASHYAFGDFLPSSTVYVANNSGNWAGTWQTYAPSYFQTALGFTPYNATNPSAFIPLTALSASGAGLTYNSSTGAFTYSSSTLGLGSAAYTASTAYLAVGGTAANSTQLNGQAASYYQTALGFTPAHSGANSDITSLSGLTTPLSAGQGGTATTTALGSNAFNSTAIPTSYVSSFNGATGTATYADSCVSGCTVTTSTTGTAITVTAGGSGTVTSASVVTANGVSATVATPSTTPAFTFTLGAIKPSTVNGLALSLGANSVSTNVAVGANALASGSLSGGSNTANGDYSLYSNITGDYNTANGYGSLSNNYSGNNNTANGYESLLYNATGGGNTANGFESLYNNTTSSNSVALGDYAGYNSTIPNAFYVGDILQSSAANDQNYSLLYGNFAGVAATTTGQFLTVNGNLNASGNFNASGTISQAGVALGSNAFTSTAIPTTYVSTSNGSSGAVTNVGSLGGATGTITLGTGLSISSNVLNVSSSLASSSFTLFDPAATTTAGYNFTGAVHIPMNYQITNIGCGEYAAATTTLSVNYATTLAHASAGTSDQVILSNFVCGIGTNTTTTFTTSTVPLGSYVFAITSSTAGTPIFTQIFVDGLKL